MSDPAFSDDIPAVDAHAIDADQPDTQGGDPLAADLGPDGQGDLAPEDEQVASGDAPQDLRTEL